MSSLERLRAAGSSFDPNQPWTEDALAAFERDVDLRFPDDVRETWLASCGGEIAPRTSLFDEGGLRELNLDADDRAEHLPEAFVFGNDNGDLLYYFDPKNRLGRGAWAVFAVERGAIGYPSSWFLAETFERFVERALADDDLWEAPRLEEEWTAAHVGEALATPGLAHLGDAATIERLYFETLLPAKIQPRRDVTLDGIPCAKDWEVHLSREGRVLYARLSATVIVRGIACRADTLLVRRDDGSLHRFTPDHDVEVRGLRCRAGGEVTLPDDGEAPHRWTHLWATLAAAATFDGVPCAEATPIGFDTSIASADPAGIGMLTKATVACACIVDGVALPAGTAIERSHERGVPYLSTARAPVPWTHRGKDHPAGKTIYLLVDG